MTDRPPRSLRSLVRRGAAWSTLDVALNRTGGFVIGMIVARLLSPHDFGIYAVALVVHAIVINVSELGVSTALVCDDDGEVAGAAPTVATIALLSSLTLGALMALGAPVFARLLSTPQAADTIRVMALTLPLAGLSAVPGTLLRRNFRMDRVFVADSANTLASAIVVVALAIAGWGPLALAWSFVAGQLLTTIILLSYSPGRYRPGWNWQEARRLLRFGLPLVGATVLGFSIQNVDYIVIAKLLGSVSLGFYLLAFNISGWPQNVISSVVRSVALPAFSRLKEEGRNMPEQFSVALRLVSRLTFPVCLFLGALAQPLIVTVYGSQWAAASKALVGLAFLAAARTVIEVFSDYLVALRRTRALLLTQVIWLPALTIALLVLVRRYGIAGAGAAHALVAWLIVMPTFIYLVGRTGVRVSLVARALLPSFCWATAAALVAWSVASQIRTPLLACAAGGIAGLAVYLVPYVPELRQLLAKLRHRRRSSRQGVIGAAT